MIKLLRTDSENKDFIELVKYLDFELFKRDGEEHAFYSQFNKINKLKYVVVAYEKGIPLACGVIKEYDKNTMEIKRMYTSQKMRGKGLASLVLIELEKWANELSFPKCILETGMQQPEAIQFYKKNGYKLIHNYGQYVGIKNSKCFEKLIKSIKLS